MQSCQAEKQIQSYEFQFQDGQLDSDNALKHFYTNKLTDLVNMIDQKQLRVTHFSLLTSSSVKVNTCYVLKRGVTASLEKILRQMNGERLSNLSNSSASKTFDKFCYLDFYFQNNKSLMIRALKVPNKQDLNKEYFRYYPYIFVHIYLRQDDTYPIRQKYYFQQKQNDSEMEQEEVEQEEKPAIFFKNKFIQDSNQNLWNEGVKDRKYFENYSFQQPSNPVKEAKQGSPKRQSYNTHSKKSEELFQLKLQLLEKQRTKSRLGISISDAEERLYQLKQIQSSK